MQRNVQVYLAGHGPAPHGGQGMSVTQPCSAPQPQPPIWPQPQAPAAAPLLTPLPAPDSWPRPQLYFWLRLSTAFPVGRGQVPLWVRGTATEKVLGELYCGEAVVAQSAHLPASLAPPSSGSIPPTWNAVSAASEIM